MTIGMIVLYGTVSFALAVLVYLISKAFGFENLYTGKIDIPGLPKIENPPWWAYLGMFFYLCVLAPVTEELLFRLVLFKIGFALTSSVVVVVLITSILFAVAHATKWPQFPLPQLVGGVIMGMAFLIGGIHASIGVHAVHNFLSGMWVVIRAAWHKTSATTER